MKKRYYLSDFTISYHYIYKCSKQLEFPIRRETQGKGFSKRYFLQDEFDAINEKAKERPKLGRPIEPATKCKVCGDSEIYTGRFCHKHFLKNRRKNEKNKYMKKKAKEDYKKFFKEWNK